MAKILLIDDDDRLREFLRQALENDGHQTACLERAEGGLDVLAGGEFDLVLIDQHMPGIPGSEFLKMLRKKGVRIPAILITGLAPSAIVDEVKDLDTIVVSKLAGGNDEFWKELAPKLHIALQAETSIAASLARAVELALKAGKTRLHVYLRSLLNQELLSQVSIAAKGNDEAIERLLGVPRAELLEDESGRPNALSFQTKALVLIANHPEMTVAEFARRLGCGMSKLRRDPIINRALLSRSGGRRRRPGGYKDDAGNLEAFE
ncbi:MAG: response regulator [Planctomycetes bacterium]|nr:response regulator [Planctomycetota bacterium]